MNLEDFKKKWAELKVHRSQYFTIQFLCSDNEISTIDILTASTDSIKYDKLKGTIVWKMFLSTETFKFLRTVCNTAADHTLKITYLQSDDDTEMGKIVFNNIKIDNMDLSDCLVFNIDSKLSYITLIMNYDRITIE